MFLINETFVTKKWILLENFQEKKLCIKMVFCTKKKFRVFYFIYFFRT